MCVLFVRLLGWDFWLAEAILLAVGAAVEERDERLRLVRHAELGETLFLSHTNNNHTSLV